MMTFTGNGNSTQSIGHGLSKIFEWAIFNNLDDNKYRHWMASSFECTRSPHNQYWQVNNLTGNDSNNTQVFPTVPTNTVFNIGNNNAVNGSNDTMVILLAWCRRIFSLW